MSPHFTLLSGSFFVSTDWTIPQVWPPLLGAPKWQVWASHKLQEMPLLPRGSLSFSKGTYSHEEEEPEVMRDPLGTFSFTS